MTDVGNVYDLLDKQHAEEPATTRRGFVAATAGMLGGMGLLAMPGMGLAASAGKTHIDDPDNNPQTILNIAATAEVLATIVNTVGFRTVDLGDDVTRRNIGAAAEQELIHYRYLKRNGAMELTKKIWVPDAVFASRENLLNTLQIGDQIFVNAYLIGTYVFAKAGAFEVATVAAEIMGVEGVHRALARQSLGLLGNDRVFMRFDNRENAAGVPGAPGGPSRGFQKITTAAARLQEAGFGFGAEGASPGKFYDFDQVKKRTPNPRAVNTRKPQ